MGGNIKRWPPWSTTLERDGLWRRLCGLVYRSGVQSIPRRCIKHFFSSRSWSGRGETFFSPRSFLGYEYSMTGRWDNAIEWILKFSLFSLFLNIGEGHVVWCQTSYLPQVPNIFLSTTHSSPSSHQLEISTVCQVLVMTLRQFNDCLNLNKSHNIVDDHLCKHVIIFNKYPKQEVCRA